jgi:caa(3)-type oxidase subunit IV
MSSMASGESEQSPSMKLYLRVWIGLMLIVVVEALLTYARLPALTLLISLLALAFIEAGVALLYFMHLKYERRILFWSLIPALIFVLVLLDHIWPDAFRLHSLRLPSL